MLRNTHPSAPNTKPQRRPIKDSPCLAQSRVSSDQPWAASDLGRLSHLAGGFHVLRRQWQRRETRSEQMTDLHPRLMRTAVEASSISRGEQALSAGNGHPVIAAVYNAYR